MQVYAEMSNEQLLAAYAKEKAHFEDCKAQGLDLNMARGKPAKAQLDAVSGILTVLSDPEECIADNTDVRNYGELAGMPSARAFWADILGCKPEQTVLGGTSSLNLAFDVISRAYSHGLLHSPRPWCKEETVKFLCPSPGYDRHFAISELFGMEIYHYRKSHDGKSKSKETKEIQ